MLELVRYIVSALVDDQDAIEITEREEADAIIIQVMVAPEDTGKIIGKNGRIAKAIRTVIKSAAPRSGKPYLVKIA